MSELAVLLKDHDFHIFCSEVKVSPRAIIGMGKWKESWPHAVSDPAAPPSLSAKASGSRTEISGSDGPMW